MNFGDAIAAAKTGATIMRNGWNGKSMWVCYVPPHSVPDARGNIPPIVRKFVPSGAVVIGAHFVMWTAQGIWQPGWLASQQDMLADDWRIRTYGA